MFHYRRAFNKVIKVVYKYFIMFVVKLTTPPQARISCYSRSTRGAQVASNAAPVHPARPIGCFRPADHHLLGIAAAQRAGSAERAMVDNRHRPACAPVTRGNHLRGGAGADD